MLRAVLYIGLLFLSACTDGKLFHNDMPDCRVAQAVIEDPDNPDRKIKSGVRVCRTKSSPDWYVSPRFQ